MLLFWILLACVVVTLAYQQWWLRRGVSHVSVHDIKAMISANHRYFLADVREPSEYAAGHISGAVSVPLGSLAQVAADWDRSREIFVVCQSGRRSVLACRQLAAMGFTKVWNVDGGMRRWPWGTV